MPLTGRLRHNEEGATLVLVAISLIMLFGFAAIAVDGAMAWSQKRENQAAADTGALAGAQFVEGKPEGQAMDDAETEVIRITYNTIEPDMTFSEWQAAWVACRDPDKPGEYTKKNISDCVTFTADLTKMRVRLPEIEVQTAFARVLGHATIATSGEAEVELVPTTTDGGVLPFGLPWAFGGDLEVCLKTGSNPKNVPPCDGPADGNFGFLDITQFGSNALGTSTNCTGDANGRIARNIAQGADHKLSAAASESEAPLIDRVVCTSGEHHLEPHTITTEAGDKTGVLHTGLVDGFPSDGVSGRLARGDNLRTIEGDGIDDTPLWQFLNTNGENLCGAVSTHTAMIACLGTWTTSDGVIFSDEIMDAPRWAWVPLFWETTFGNGSTDRTIRDFGAVYLQTTFWKCSNSNCSIIHDPAETVGGDGKGGGNKEIEAITAIQIPKLALSEDVRASANGTPGETVYVLVK
jgi:Flp pilus assembly protein TadG